MEVGHKVNVVLAYHHFYFSQQCVPSFTAQMRIFCGSDTPEFYQTILHQKSQINGAISVDMRILSYRVQFVQGVLFGLSHYH